MTVRKITIDNSINHIINNNHSHVSNERKKIVPNKNLSQKNKRIIKNNAAEGLKIIK